MLVAEDNARSRLQELRGRVGTQPHRPSKGVSPLASRLAQSKRFLMV